MSPGQHALARSFYDEKTASIIQRYGPGPRVHYHVGIFDSDDLGTHGVSADQLRQRIKAAQERLLARAADVWDAESIFTGTLLDLGCGLGGGSLYWAGTFGAQVTSLTNVARHVALIESFATDAGLRDRITTELGDACELTEAHDSVEAAVAFESSSHMSRQRLFPSVAHVLPRGGYFCIEDIFAGRPEYQKPFDDYYRTHCGTLHEYVETARAAGFALDRNEDVTTETTEFWLQSAAWAEKTIDESGADQPFEDRMLRSIKWHTNFMRAWRERVLEVRLLRFRKI